jgi:hypothetical protein
MGFLSVCASRSFYSALRFCVILAVAYILIFFFSLGAVNGDGSAPLMTQRIIWTLDFALNCMGLKGYEKGLFFAAGFWALVFFVIIYIFQFIKNIIFLKF